MGPKGAHVSHMSNNNKFFYNFIVGVGYLVDPASGICLSQGLSHASLSMSELYNETANGSVKQL